MASWNGACYESADPNLYDFPFRTPLQRIQGNWNYYSQNESNPSTEFTRSSGGSHHDVQGTVQPQYLSQQTFFENNRSQPNLPSFKCKSGNPGSKGRKKNRSGGVPFGNMQAVDPCIVENSNLHATAGEFIPRRTLMQNTVTIEKGNESMATAEYGDVQSYVPDSSDIAPETGLPKPYYSDGKNKHNKREKKFDDKKHSAYKARDVPDNHYHNPNSYKTPFKNQNTKNRQYQSDRYANRKQYPQNSRNYSGERDNDRKKWSTELGAMQKSTESDKGSFESETMQPSDKDDQSVDKKYDKYYNSGAPHVSRHSGRSSKHYNEYATESNVSSHNLEAYYSQGPIKDQLRPIKDTTPIFNDQLGGRSSQYYNEHVNKSNSSNYNSEADYSQASVKGPRRYFNDDRGERYRERRDRYTDRWESGGWEKKTYYSDYNGYRNHYDRGDRSDRIREKEQSKERDSSRDIRDKEVENWRRKSDDGHSGSSLKRTTNRRHDKDDDASQRERLTEQLNRGQLECLVCCDRVKQQDPVWSCSNCYHVLHLKCVKKWAKSSQSDNGWRCPACQNVSAIIPEEYLCFCGNMSSPEWNRRDVAHSCGNVCGRMRSKTNCTHTCILLCHPGPCPPCVAMVTKFCGCGRTSQTVKCSTGIPLFCASICEKTLNCGTHTCEKSCHHGECGDCEKLIHQECHCGKENRDVTCVANVSLTYTCNSTCNKLLECGNHNCTATCHPGPCEPCVLRPEAVAHCCCGQTPLTEPRTSCLDEIPVCEKTCCKRLKCGQPSNPHICKIKCHEGDCPECELTTKVKCRCGNMDKEIPCKELTTKADDARCQKRCAKKRSCGRHKCNQMCCIDIEHICPLPCSHTLSCGRHKCEQTCHKGRCQPCWRSSFDELHCECGAAVIYPPVPCGTRRPACDRPCSRQHSCDHPVLHNCHSESTCPPCSVLTQKWCYGNHELRKAVPCHVNEVSCGLPCAKPLLCKRHKCITLCHSGPCDKPGLSCVQPCTTPRELCGHICSAPCHDGKCPDIPCKETVKVTCQCGHRTMSRACAENSREFQRIASGILASKMAEMQLGHSVDLEEVLGQGARRQNQLKTLECNDECKLIERNRRLALGLQIVNPDLSGKLMPRYSEFMKQWAKKDPMFCQMIHDRLTELVQLAKTSKQKSRSYSFDSMNRDKRHLVHEYCGHFGCESQAYDREPKRNIVATAVKDKCWLPSLSVLELMQRESGQRKVPGPMLNAAKASNSFRNVDVLPLPVKKGHKTLPVPTSSKSPEPEIDYFDYRG